MNWLGLDIGGANLKVADGRGFVLSRPFPLWKNPLALPAMLEEMILLSPPTEALAVTMTGELADCFATKAEGVGAILQAVEAAGAGRVVSVYLTDGFWVSPEVALNDPLRAAASNWHALARFAGRHLTQRSGLVIDIGSTTCDIIPLTFGRVAARGRSDPERMVYGELVYTGVVRSPVCAVVDRVPWRGRSCPVAQELFATAWDVYLLLGDLPEEPGSTSTADGRPATRTAAHDRLARAICADRTMVSVEDARAIAEAVADSQLDTIAEAADRVMATLPERPHGVVLSGLGEFLGRRALHRLGLSARIVSLAEQLGPEVSRAATAHALAILAAETAPAAAS